MTSAVLKSVGATPASELDSRGVCPAIPLRGRGGYIRAFVTVDPEDYAWVSQFNWHLHKSPNDRIGYAVRSVKVGKTVHTEFLHRRILGLERGDTRQGDHKNRNSLDNRRSNLRLATHAENGQNKSGHTGTSSKYRGVSYRKDIGKWAATVRVGTTKHLGYFKTEREAADVASRYREQYMPYSEEASA